MGNSVRNIMAISSKEFKGYFSSPVAWVLMGLFAALFGYFFSVYLGSFISESMGGQFGQGPQTVNVNQRMIRPLLSNATVLILFLLPMVTMRTYSEEKRSGTIELLLTSPITDVEIVVGKFFGAMGMYLGLLAVTAVYMSILFIWGNPAWMPLLSGYLGLVLLGGSFVAMGLFISSLTANQMVAGVASFVVFLLLWIISWFGDSVGPTMASILRYLSITEHFDDFGKGVIDSKHVIFYLSFIAFGLFLATKSVDSDRWEGLVVKNLVGFLGWLGVALVGVALYLKFTKPELDILYKSLAGAGFLVTAIYAYTQRRDLGRSFQGRNAQYGSIAAGSVLVFLGILVAINWISNRQNKRWDLTDTKEFSLSDQTKQIVTSLKAPLKIKVFWASTSDRPDSAQAHRDRLEGYSYLSNQVSIDYVDATGSPTESEKYAITAVPTLVLEYAGRTQRATSDDEQSVTNALKKVIEGKAKKAYFTQGHGEKDPDDAQTGQGYKGITAALADENFEAAKLQIAQRGSIPVDATVVVVAGATGDFLPQETELIRTFLKNGGKVLLMIDPPVKGGTAQPSGLIALAKEWGIQIGDDIVVDPTGQLVGFDASVPVGMPVQHPITAKTTKMTAFRLARSVAPVEGGTDGRIAQTFIQSGEKSWAEKDVKGLYETGAPKQDVDKGDKAGPISLGAAVSAPATGVAPSAEPDAPKPESRLVVLGDSDFASNAMVQVGGNSDLFLNAANWLAQQENLIAIRPKSPEDRRLQLTQAQQTNVFWLTLVIIPLLLFGNAFRVYWKRR